MMKNKLHLVALTAVLIIIMTACQQSDKGMVITVNGAVELENLGLSLSHEHLLVDFIGADSIGYHRWDRATVLKRMLPFLEEIKSYGVESFVDATPAYLGRDPELLKMLSEKSGLNIITNTGYYGAKNNMYVPKDALEMSADELASIWIDEFENGIENTGIRPGFIKIAVDPSDTLSTFHKELVKAAALTHLSTGLVIVSHTGPDAPAFEQLDILIKNDVSPSAFIWTHAQRGSLEGIIEAAEMGAWISIDNVNASRDAQPGSLYNSEWYVSRLSALKEAGVLDRILISHDAGWYRPGEASGGEIRGFTAIFTNLIPALEQNGFTQQDIEQLLVINPGNAFAIR